MPHLCSYKDKEQQPSPRPRSCVKLHSSPRKTGTGLPRLAFVCCLLTFLFNLSRNQTIPTRLYLFATAPTSSFFPIFYSPILYYFILTLFSVYYFLVFFIHLPYFLLYFLCTLFSVYYFLLFFINLPYFLLPYFLTSLFATPIFSTPLFSTPLFTYFLLPLLHPASLTLPLLSYSFPSHIRPPLASTLPSHLKARMDGTFRTVSDARQNLAHACVHKSRDFRSFKTKIKR